MSTVAPETNRLDLLRLIILLLLRTNTTPLIYFCLSVDLKEVQALVGFPTLEVITPCHHHLYLVVLLVELITGEVTFMPLTLSLIHI